MKYLGSKLSIYAFFFCTGSQPSKAMFDDSIGSETRKISQVEAVPMGKHGHGDYDQDGISLSVHSHLNYKEL